MSDRITTLFTLNNNIPLLNNLMTPLRCMVTVLCLATQCAANSSQIQFQNPTFLSQFDIIGFDSPPAMATLLEHANGWHPGERAVHTLLKVPTSGRENPTASGLPPSYGHRVAVSPLLAVGTVDDQGRPWTSIWGGERGFARPVAQGILGVQSLVDEAHDPVVQALLGKAADGEVLQPEDGKVMSALSIDLESRDRVKLAGKMIVGSLAARHDSNDVAEAQIAMLVQESLGNCPKYLNKKTIRAHVPSPHLASATLPLSSEALALIEQADMFFLSSFNGQTMDTNHRGGPVGFVRVLSNSPPKEGDDGGVVLVYPEYSGNRLYQTLGNLHTNPLLGIAIPDFTTSDILYLTGSTQLLVGAAAASVMPHTNLAVKVTIHSARLVKNSLPFRGTPSAPSPYNPPVRRLTHELPSSLLPQPLHAQHQSPSYPTALATLTLTHREPLTPTIARFTFLLRSSPNQQENEEEAAAAAPALKQWRPGQHITLSFARELDHGYAHMRDADPQSLNDDFVRTFTISSVPPLLPPPSSSLLLSLSAASQLLLADGGAAHSGAVTHSGAGIGQNDGVEVQLTLRKHGPVTRLLFAQPLGATVPLLEVDVLGVGGEEGFRILPDAAAATATGEGEDAGRGRKKAVFVAGGIGITPLLAQAPGVVAAVASGVLEVEVLWSLRGEDLGLAVDAFVRVEGLGRVVRVFVTGVAGGESEEQKGMVERLRELGAKVEMRRMGKADVLGARGVVRGTKYFACASPGMLRSVMDWLGEEEVVFESFEY